MVDTSTLHTCVSRVKLGTSLLFLDPIIIPMFHSISCSIATLVSIFVVYFQDHYRSAVTCQTGATKILCRPHALLRALKKTHLFPREHKK